jgi:hypothetical protein
VTTRVCGDGEWSGGGVDGYGACCAYACTHMNKRAYHAYLKSDEWRKKRAEARRRARNRCRICGATENLHTHHKTYSRVGREAQHDLVVLCAKHHEGCHEFIHEWRKKGWKPKSDYTLSMKYIAREKKKLRKK